MQKILVAWINIHRWDIGMLRHETIGTRRLDHNSHYLHPNRWYGSDCWWVSFYINFFFSSLRRAFLRLLLVWFQTGNKEPIIIHFGEFHGQVCWCNQGWVLVVTVSLMKQWPCGPRVYYGLFGRHLHAESWKLLIQISICALLWVYDHVKYLVLQIDHKYLHVRFSRKHPSTEHV
jgi:hypothetical protein